MIEGEQIIYSDDGWLQAENVPQQVLYNGESLLGCGLAEHPEIEIEESKVCGTQAGYFCSYDSWSKEELPKFAYDDDNVLVASSEIIFTGRQELEFFHRSWQKHII